MRYDQRHTSVLTRVQDASSRIGSLSSQTLIEAALASGEPS
jgi:hypothetical protein